MIRIVKPRKLSAIFVSSGLLTTLACSSFAFRTPDPGPEGGSGQRPGVAADWPQGSSPRLETRQACRAAARPSGWIAVSYLRLGEECQKSGDDPFNGVLLQAYGDRPVGSVLDICADQVVPRDWFRDPEPAATDCEGAHVKQGEPTAIRIRRTASTG